MSDWDRLAIFGIIGAYGLGGAQAMAWTALGFGTWMLMTKVGEVI